MNSRTYVQSDLRESDDVRSLPRRILDLPVSNNLQNLCELRLQAEHARDSHHLECRWAISAKKKTSAREDHMT